MTDRPYDHGAPAAPRHLAGGDDRVADRHDPAGAGHEDELVDADGSGYEDELVDEADGGYAGELGDPAEDEYVEVRSGRRGTRIVLIVVLALVVALVGAAALAGLWVQRQINPPGGPGDEVVLEVPEGATTDAIGRLLADEGVITDRTVWRWYIRINGGGPFQAGRYELRQNSSMGSVVAALEAGPARPDALRFTIPEGLTFDQTLDRLADPDLGLGLDRDRMEQLLVDRTVRSRHLPEDAESFEGILYPETYEVAVDADEQVVLQRMVDQLDRVLDQLEVHTAEARFGLTPYEVLIAASLIERESRVQSERPKVARVIYNRLSQGIPLGIDATSCYEKGEVPCRLVTADFESDSPYNTRRVPGLPPTPISSPGRDSITAALDPEDGPWIFYVLADAEGNHFFTDSAAEFERAKAECIRQGLGCG